MTSSGRNLAPVSCAGTAGGSDGGSGPDHGPGEELDGTDDCTGDPALPGVVRVDPALVRQLRQATETMGVQYRPRTRHLKPDGTAAFTNRLILEASPYLLQHAHNPVNFFPWGQRAFARAEQEDKPVLLSVGYSTCHWCHVMERESFEDLEIAKCLNEYYVSIKVDREERPDVDELYMRAVNLMTGRGGWPMTVFLTPAKVPFFAGTYFPPRDREGVLGFLSLIERIRLLYDERRGELHKSAETLRQAIQQVSQRARAGAVPGPEALARAAEMLIVQHDQRWGGFGQAPKFPQPDNISLLLRHYRRSADPRALHAAVHTLHQMAKGGIYDQVGGGFHRYSTDEQWLVPHFEKMLYDNALLAAAYLEGYQVTGDSRLATVARETLDYVAREMISQEGGFYSATDADSATERGEHEEGYYFTWTPREIEQAAGKARGRLLLAYYAVTAAGNFEGRNVLHMPATMQRVAEQLGVASDRLTRELQTARRALYRARLQRPAPARDDKILTSWNGLMISAFAKGALVLDKRRYGEIATRAARFVLNRLRDSRGRLLRTYRHGKARHNAYAEDYAFVITALIDLYEATWNLRWIKEAVALQKVQDRHYLDAEEGGYFMTSDDHERLLTRDKPCIDAAIPSLNSVSICNLLRLAEYTGEASYRANAERGLGAFAWEMARGAAPHMLQALDFYLDASLQIVIVKPEAGSGERDFLRELRRVFIPNRTLSVHSSRQLARAQRLLPVLQGRVPLQGRTTAFVCERGRCERPTSDPAVFAAQIARAANRSCGGGDAG